MAALSPAPHLFLRDFGFPHEATDRWMPLSPPPLVWPMTTPTNRPLPPVLDEHWNEDSTTAWPGNVPSRTQALEALRDRLVCPLPLPGARRVREKLTPPEREALQGTRFCPLLREATVVRWRLAAAADLLPAAGARRSAVALRALLIEVNQMLGALKAATSSAPELALALDAAGEKLGEESNALLHAVKAAATQRRAPPPRAPRPLPVPRTHRVAGRGRRPHPLLSASLALGVLVAGFALAQGRASARARASAAAASGASDVLVVPHPESGALLVRSTRVGPETEAQRAWLRLQEAKGLTVTRLGPGSYLVAPALALDASLSLIRP
jgi:hypothetical protein